MFDEEERSSRNVAPLFYDLINTHKKRPKAAIMSQLLIPYGKQIKILSYDTIIFCEGLGLKCSLFD